MVCDGKLREVQRLADPLFLDLLLGRVGEGKGGRFLALHDRFPERLIDNGVGNRAATALVWLWFRLTLHAARMRG